VTSRVDSYASIDGRSASKAFSVEDVSAACGYSKRVRIGDALVLVNGRAFKPTEWTDRGLPIIRIQNLNDPEAPFNHYAGELPERFRVNPGELLFAWSGTPGTSFGAHIWRGGDAWLNQHIFKVQFDDKQFDKRFLREAINQNLNQYIAAAHGGAGLAHITKGKFESFTILCPPIESQQEIVAELEKQFSRLDEAVANLKRVKANLKRYKASVLKAAVEGRLVPTEAELAHREGRSYESGAQLLQRILDTRRSQWAGKGKYSEPAAPDSDNRPDIPKGWQWTNVDQLAQVGTGATPSRGRADYYDGGTVPWVTSAVVNERYVDRPSEYVTTTALAETNLTLYPVGTLIVAMYGEGKTRGKCAELRIAATTNQALAALRVDPHVCSYLKMFLEHNYEETRKVASGGVQPNLNLSLVRSIAVPLPPLIEQHRIVAEVDRRLSLVRGVEAEVNANLKRAWALQQAVLQQAFLPPATNHDQA
jgi:type I restriction enzyme S subunit